MIESKKKFKFFEKDLKPIFKIGKKTYFAEN
jgi:hypothetical protein